MIHILYLAAGQSRRYGSNKLLELRNGKPLYRYGLDAIRTAMQGRKDCTLTVVTCWQEIADTCAADGIRCIPCPDSHRGISYSIRTGIQSCEPLCPEDYLCFSVADQPGLMPESIVRLLDTALEQPLTACLSCGEQAGNPTLFSAALAEELCALEGDCGGKAVMRRHPEKHVDVPCHAEELLDVDIREDSQIFKE